MGADRPSHSHNRMEMEAKRIAELPSGTAFEKKGSYSLFFLNQQIQPGFSHRTGFTLGVALLCGSVWHLWRPQGLNRMAAEGVCTGTRPAGRAGEAGG